MISSNSADISFIQKLNKNISYRNEIKEKFMRFKGQDAVFFKEEGLLSFHQRQNDENESRKFEGLKEKKCNFFNEIDDTIKSTDPIENRNEAIPFKSHLFSNNY